MTDPAANAPGIDRVAEAIEMIRGRRICGAGEAFALIVEKSVQLGQDLELTALDVIDEVIRFDSE